MSIYGYKPYNPKPETAYWLEKAEDVLDQYRDNWPLTVRQVFYRLVASANFAKTEKAYKQLAGWIARARRASLLQDPGTTPLIPFEAIRDDKLTQREALSYENEGEFYEAVRESADRFAFDRQLGQPRVLEFWCEAAGMMPILTALALPYSIPVSSSGGYDSVTTKHELAQRVAARTKDGIGTLICHVGDFDGSGEDMCENMRIDVGVMVYQLTGEKNHFDIERVALTAEQVIDYSVITAPAKGTDSRSPKFLDNHWELVEQLGTEDISAQLEALTPPQLTALLQGAIDSHLDREVFDAALEREREVREAVQEKVRAL